MELKPLEESKTPFDAGGLRVSHGEDQQTPTIDYQSKTLKLFYGDMHAHSDISVCVRCSNQSLDERI